MFDILKVAIISVSILVSSDTATLFCIKKDSSDYIIGVILSQESKVNSK